MYRIIYYKCWLSAALLMAAGFASPAGGRDASSAAATAAIAGEARADAIAGPLRWERRRADVRLGAGGKTVSALFAFVNTSGKPVRITSVESSCGCTAGKPDREVYAPGERGELRVEFDAGSRRGVQANWVDVRTDAGGDPVRLDFVVTIPEPLTVMPRMLTWVVATEIAKGDVSTLGVRAEGGGGGGMGTKRARVQFDRQETGRIERVEAVPEAAWLRVDVTRADAGGSAMTGGGGEEWALSVTPEWHDAARPWRSAVTITAHTEKLGQLKVRLFVVCR